MDSICVRSFFLCVLWGRVRFDSLVGLFRDEFECIVDFKIFGLYIISCTWKVKYTVYNVEME